MSRNWPKARVGDALCLQRRWLALDPQEQYIEIGIRSFGKGMFRKPPVSGASLGSKRVLTVKPGDLVFSNVFAWEGAVAIAGPDEAGTIGSHRFVTYTAADDSIDLRFLLLFFRTKNGIDILQEVSPGSAGRNRTLNLELFSEQRIPMPPIELQKRLVERFMKLSMKVDEVQRSIVGVGEDLDRLCQSLIFANRSDSPRSVPMRELVTPRAPDVVVLPETEYQFAGVYSFGRGVFQAERKMGTEISYPRLARLRANDLVYLKLGAWEGAFGVVPERLAGMVVSPEFPVFEIDQDRVLPDTLETYFRTPAIWPTLADTSVGTNVRRRRLHPDAFLSVTFPLPDMPTQLRLTQIRRRAKQVAEFQKETEKSLGALLPSFLDRAFKGEL